MELYEDKLGELLRAVNTTPPQEAYTTNLSVKLEESVPIIYDWLRRLVAVGILEECPLKITYAGVPAGSYGNFNTCGYRLSDMGKKALRAWIKRQDEADAEQDAA